MPTEVDSVTGLPHGLGAILVDTAGQALQDVRYPPDTFGRGVGTADDPTPLLMGTYTVWIRNDTAECRQGAFTTDRNGSVVIRSQGMAIDNRTNVILEVTMGPSGGPGEPGTAAPAAPVLCNSGKNACEDNNSTQYGIVVN